MSELQKHWAKAKLAHLAGLEADLPSFEEEAEDEVPELRNGDRDGDATETEQAVDDDSSSASSASSASSTGTVIPSPGHGLFARAMG